MLHNDAKQGPDPCLTFQAGGNFMPKVAPAAVGHQAKTVLALVMLPKVSMSAMQQFQRCQDGVEQLFLWCQDQPHFSLHMLQLLGQQ